MSDQEWYELRTLQVRAVEQALDMEQHVNDRGAFDRGVQAACACIRQALDDPDSILNPQPAVAASTEGESK